MRDYALLAKTFRYCYEGKSCAECPMQGNCPDIDGRKNAADAIEELVAKNNELWIQCHVEGGCSLISEPPKEVE